MKKRLCGTLTVLAAFLTTTLGCVSQEDTPPQPKKTAASVAKPIADGLRADLPDGRAIELLAISYAPPNGHLYSDPPPKDQVWWKPDGTPFDKPPFATFGAQCWTGGQMSYEFVYHFSGFPKGSNPYFSADSGGANANSAGDDVVKTTDLKPLQDMLASTFCITQDAVKTTIKIAVSEGPWTIEGAETASGKAESGGRANVFFSQAVSEFGVTVTATHNVRARDVRLVAIDKDGGVHGGEGGSGPEGEHMKISGFFKGLPPERVQSYQLQSREFQWAEFRDVALRPNVKRPAPAEKAK